GRDWSRQNACEDVLSIAPGAPVVSIVFDMEYLRRVVTNLLDNALRYASRKPASIQISVPPGGVSGPAQTVCLGVWSDGAALDASVEQHLFEPFFSSESRSSGLGLYICRELCESHGALIGHERTRRVVMGQLVPGNEFFVTFRQTTDHRTDQVTSSTP
ncbi:MAG: ATP-binding protein, partial [Rhodoferax sp.]|nr:ATP-binding protein [Rhodoferax sp.]